MLTIYGLGEVLRLQAHFNGVKWVADQCHTDTTCEAVLGSALYNLVKDVVGRSAVSQDIPHVPASTSLLAFNTGP